MPALRHTTDIRSRAAWQVLAEYTRETRLAAKLLHGWKRVMFDLMIRQIPAPTKAEVGQLVSSRGARAHCAARR